MKAAKSIATLFSTFAAIAAMGLAVGACSSDDTPASSGAGGSAGSAGSSGSSGASGSAGSSGGTTYTLENICDTVAKELCASRKSCCKAGSGYSEAGCMTREKVECEKGVTAVKAGNSEFNADKVDACLAAVKSYNAKCAPSIDDQIEFQKNAAACGEAFKGKTAEGEACEADAECASGDLAFGDCDEKTKKCIVRKIAKSGEACSFESGSALCDQGLYCDIDFTMMPLKGTCKTKTALGAACDGNKMFNLECGLGFYCKAGTCAPAFDEGAACMSDLECKNLNCGDMSKKCEASTDNAAEKAAEEKAAEEKAAEKAAECGMGSKLD